MHISPETRYIWKGCCMGLRYDVVFEYSKSCTRARNARVHNIYCMRTNGITRIQWHLVSHHRVEGWHRFSNNNSISIIANDLLAYRSHLLLQPGNCHVNSSNVLFTMHKGVDNLCLPSTQCDKMVASSELRMGCKIHCRPTYTLQYSTVLPFYMTHEFSEMEFLKHFCNACRCPTLVWHALYPFRKNITVKPFRERPNRDESSGERDNG